MYTKNDITIYKSNDAIKFIRDNPQIFFGNQTLPDGYTLASALFRDIALHDALPLKITKTNNWWVLIADKDWLKSQEGGAVNVFSQMLPFPPAGTNACRAEVLVTAFAKAVITAGKDGTHWISGNEIAKASLPNTVQTDMNGSNKGRLVAFLSPE